MGIFLMDQLMSLDKILISLNFIFL